MYMHRIVYGRSNDAQWEIKRATGKRQQNEQPFLLPAELLPEEQFSTNESPVLLNSQDSIKHT